MTYVTVEQLRTFVALLIEHATNCGWPMSAVQAYQLTSRVEQILNVPAADVKPRSRVD